MNNIANTAAKNMLPVLEQIRLTTNSIFQAVGDGYEDHTYPSFASNVQDMLEDVDTQMKTLEGSVAQMQSHSNVLMMGNLDADSAVDSFNLYSSLTSSHKWLDKAHDYSGLSAAFLSQNSLKRSACNRGRRKNMSTSHIAPPSSLNSTVDGVNEVFNDMKLTINRPGGTQLNAIVEVHLDRILKAVVIFKGLMIEWVVVKGWEEELVKSHGQPDIWGDSRYKVFQRITENANAAMLHFQSPVCPDLAVRSFMTYLHSFNSLFNDKCRQCAKHLHNHLPPTWREFRTLEPFHEDCRPGNN